MDAPCAADVLFRCIDELDGYPEWMSLTHRVERLAAEEDGRPAWDVELRARIGPFARSKRLRMVRTEHSVPDRSVRFERVERDGRSHSAWVLAAHVTPVLTDVGETSQLDMHLHYAGALWTGGVMERVLADQIVAGRERLLTLVAPRLH